MSGTAWIVSYVLLWLAVVFLSAVVVALLRQVGVLHTRLRPLGVHPGGEGPEIGDAAPPLPAADYGPGVTLVAFTSSTCLVCAELAPALRALRHQYPDVRVEDVPLETARSVFDAFRVRSTPFFVTVGPDGHVRGRGVANSLEQVEMLIAHAGDPA